MIEIIEGFPRNVVGIAVKGRVTMQDCRQILTPAIETSLKWRDRIRLYYEINSRFPGAGWDDLDLGFEHAARCERVAIVTDIAWVGLTIRALRFLIPGEVRVFATIQADEGRAWITARAALRTETPATETPAPAGRRSSRTRRPPDPAPARVTAATRPGLPSHSFA
ncbi:MAG TPA: STAS/SEC14 domain-containing protein [Stellaceae bacterium]|nr:STAS/SEC14 domain-containing protein [Stellaceae bacterium]